jgi:hypothetical protein
VSFIVDIDLDDWTKLQEWDQYVAKLFMENEHTQRFALWENQCIMSAIRAPSESFAHDMGQSTTGLANAIISHSDAFLALSTVYMFDLNCIRELSGSACFSGQFHRTRGFYSTDPRDKVFSLLAVSDFPDIKIVPDYSKSVRDVFSEATAFILREHFLYMYPYTSLSGKMNLDLPSWVPDLNRPDCVFTHPDHPYYLCPDDNALQQLAEDMERFGPLVDFSQDYTILQTRGLHLGFITAMASIAAENITGKGEWLQHTLQSLHRNNATFSPKLILDGLAPKKPSVSEAWNLLGQEESDLLDNLLDFNQSRGHTPDPRYQSIYDLISFGNLNRLFFWTDTGRLGVTVDDGLVQIGDAVVGLFGVNLPFVLRKLDNGYFRMINIARLGGHTMGHDIPTEITDPELLYTHYELRDYEII